MQERGLKLKLLKGVYNRLKVAPYAGAWIEIPNNNHNPFVNDVAPYAGAWIEINLYSMQN